MGQVTELVGRGLAHFLTKPVRQSTQVAIVSQEQLLANLQPGDVLLIGGNTPNASAVRKNTLRGLPATLPGIIFSMWYSGYDTLVFSVTEILA